MQQSSLPQQVGNYALRKSMDLQQQQASQIVESIPDPQPSPSSGNKGQVIDVFT